MPEYWIVDMEARAVEVWRLGAGADAPQLMREDEEVSSLVSWTPVAGGPTLEAAGGDIFC